MNWIIQALGESDCELVGDGALAQPVNAYSSLAFSFVGLAVIVSARQVTGTERILRWVFGTILVATGMGSYLFHGPQPQGSHFLHDISFLSALAAIAVSAAAVVFGWSSNRMWALFAAAVAMLALALVVWPSATNLYTGVMLVTTLFLSLLATRTAAYAPGWLLVSGIAVAAAVALLILGRTGGLICDPASAFQGHAGWHVFAGIGLGAFFMAGTPTRTSIGGGW